MARRSDRGLLLIGIFKLAKTALLVAVGVLLLLQVRGDAALGVVRLSQHLRIDPDDKLVHRLLEQLFRLDRRKLEELSIGTFLYAGVFAIEGTGLLLAKPWAEYLTLGVTISFVPLEIFELVKRPSILKGAAIAVNVAIVIYLLLKLARRRTRETAASA